MAVRNKFIFDGKSSVDLGCYTTGTDTFNSGSKTQNKTSVNGRNGDVIIESNRFENENYNVKIGIVGKNEEDLHRKVRELRSFLLSRKGYCRYEDDYHPDEYRMAQFAGPIDFESTLLIAGEATLIFDCKPQHFLKSGEETITLTSSGTILNPTYFECYPSIRIYGYGKLEVGNGTITVKQKRTPETDYIDINGETWNAYVEQSNMNEYVSFSKNGTEHYFPEILPGENQINLDSHITKVEITPHWWMK